MYDDAKMKQWGTISLPLRWQNTKADSTTGFQKYRKVGVFKPHELVQALQKHLVKRELCQELHSAAP